MNDAQAEISLARDWSLKLGHWSFGVSPTFILHPLPCVESTRSVGQSYTVAPSNPAAFSPQSSRHAACSGLSP